MWKKDFHSGFICCKDLFFLGCFSWKWGWVEPKAGFISPPPKLINLDCKSLQSLSCCVNLYLAKVRSGLLLAQLFQHVGRFFIRIHAAVSTYLHGWWLQMIYGGSRSLVLHVSGPLLSNNKSRVLWRYGHVLHWFVVIFSGCFFALIRFGGYFRMFLIPLCRSSKSTCRVSLHQFKIHFSFIFKGFCSFACCNSSFVSF